VTLQSDKELKLTQERINDCQRVLNDAQQRYAQQPETLAALRTMYVGQIQELQREVNEYLGLASTTKAAFELAFDSQDGAEGVTTLSTFTTVAERFRKALVSIAETIRHGQERADVRPMADIARQVDLRVVGVAAGSFRVLLELPPQRTLGPTLAEQSVKAMVDGLEWLQSSLDEAPASLTDDKLQRTVLRAIQRLSPTESSQVGWVEIRTPEQGKMTSRRLNTGTLRSASTRLQELMAQETIMLIGRVRALDLDKNHYVLTDQDGHRHKFFLDPELQEDAVQYVLQQTDVIARGVRTQIPGRARKRELKIFEFEPLARRAKKASRISKAKRKPKSV